MTLRRAAQRAEYIFNHLRAGLGAESVGAVSPYAARVVALRDGTDARNIFNAEVEAYLRGILATATNNASSSSVSAPPHEEAQVRQAKGGKFDE